MHILNHRFWRSAVGRWPWVSYYSSRTFKILFCPLLVMSLLPASAAEAASSPDPRVPVIYSTDLFHPHVDPDDHFDLATLFALPELDVKAILLDQGEKQLQMPGRVPVQQMEQLTGRSVPYAIGLDQKLASPQDDGRRRPAQFQAAVELLLTVLRTSREPVTIIATGSARDLCAAYNREPELLRRGVGRMYLNMGNADAGGTEWNVQLDPHAYVGLMRSGLPIYWCPCFPIQRGASNTVYSSYWKFHQADVLETAPPALQNFFIYALQTVRPDELNPLQAMRQNLRPWRQLVWKMDRNMWCTASLLHAAGRSIYRRQDGWHSAAKLPADCQPTPVFTFVPAGVAVDDMGKTRINHSPAKPNLELLRITAAKDYEAAMRDCLMELLQQLKIVP